MHGTADSPVATSERNAFVTSAAVFTSFSFGSLHVRVPHLLSQLSPETERYHRLLRTETHVSVNASYTLFAEAHASTHIPVLASYVKPGPQSLACTGHMVAASSPGSTQQQTRGEVPKDAPHVDETPSAM